MEDMQSRQDFEAFMRDAKYSKATIENYMIYFKIIGYIDGDNEQDIVNKFCSRYPHGSARAFVKLYLEYLDINNVKIPKLRGRTKTKLPIFLSREQVELLTNYMSLRNKLMVLIMFEGGLRVTELINLTKRNINLETKEIRGTGKGNKDYVVYFSDKTKELLEYYLNSLSNDQRLFTLKRQTVWQILNEYGIKNLSMRIHPHMLRHSTATELLSKGMNLKEIQEYMRHESLDTVGIYTHVIKKEIKERVQDIFK